MLKEAIKEAATIEEATRAAALELGVPVEKMQVEILQQPQKKTFGLFGGCPARVRGYVEESAASTAAAYLKEILRGMGYDKVEIEIKEEEKGCQLALSGEEFGSIIGRRGETLDALQYLTGLVANRVDNSYYRVTIDVGNYEAFRNGEKLSLTLKEFELLKLLVISRGKVLTRDFLLDRIWGYEFYGETRTVDVHIRHIRQKLGDDAHYIETIRGVGYKFNDRQENRL